MEKTTNSNREYYTFAEIITGLRNDYIVNQELLEKLHKYIKIVSNFDTKSNLILSFKQEINPPRLSLRVSKKSSSISVLLRETLNKCMYDEVRLMIDNAFFHLIEDNDRLYFDQFNYLNLEGVFKPKVLIDNESEFASNYAELKSTKLFTLPSLYIEINPYQSLFVWGDCIHLSNKDERGREIDIEYLAEHDIISVKSNIGYPTYFIERLLKTKIPKYEFPNEYISLLDGNSEKISDLFIVDRIGRRKENLEFKSKENRLVLTKK